MREFVGGPSRNHLAIRGVREQFAAKVLETLFLGPELCSNTTVTNSLRLVNSLDNYAVSRWFAHELIDSTKLSREFARSSWF